MSMNAKDLKNKAVKIQGKNYVLVADRVVFFNENYPEGSIRTKIISSLDSEEIIMEAKVYPDYKNPDRVFIGHSQAVKGQGYINKTSALENAETSAVGRALAMMGIGVIESIASVDEINKAQNMASYQSKYPVRNPTRKVQIDPDWKKLVKDACDRIDPLLDTKEKYEEFVKYKTGMELREENAEAIVSTLNNL